MGLNQMVNKKENIKESEGSYANTDRITISLLSRFSLYFQGFPGVSEVDKPMRGKQGKQIPNFLTPNTSQ